MTARLRIDRAALGENYQLFQRSVAGAAGVVVKADAYGLGLEEVCRVFTACGCRHFFVAQAAEAVAVRRLSTDAEVFVFEGATAESAAVLAATGVTPVINHAAQLAAWAPYRDRPIAVHVDTGMQRLGYPHDVAADSFDGYRVNLLLTHLACADEPEHPDNALQLERFARVCERFPGVPTSIGNSAGSLLGSEFHGDVVRAGIGLYGANPFREAPLPVETVAVLEARILQVREVAAGAAIGYGATNRVDRDRRVAVLGIGYADGLLRSLSNKGFVVIDGQRCPIVGRVSMDLTAVDVSDVRADVDDWAELFGANLPIDEVAELAGTIAYELLTGVGNRVARVYEN